MNINSRPFPRRSFLAVLLLAGVIRGGLLSRPTCISRDGVHFVTFAKQLDVEPVRWMRITTKQPGYSFLLLWTHRLIGSSLGGDTPLAWQRTGELVALIGGVAVCGLIFLLTCYVFDDRYALLAGVLCAFWTQGALLSADVLSDMPHLAVYLASLLCALAGARSGGLLKIIVAGFMAAAAYWIRQEALGLVAAIGLCLLLERGLVPRRRFVYAAVFAACFIIGAAPYSVLKGSIMPNKNPFDIVAPVHKPAKKKSAKHAATTKPARPTPRASSASKPAETNHSATPRPATSSASRTRKVTANKTTITRPVERPLTPPRPHVGHRLPVWELPGRMAEDWARSGRFILAALVLAALVLKSLTRVDPRGGRFIGIAIAMQLLLVAARTTVYGEISSRYMAIPAALTIPWAAVALFTLTTRVATRIYNPTRPRRAAVWTSALIMTLAPMLFYMVRSEPKNKNALRMAGLALAAERGPDDLVISHPRMEQLLYYADLIWPDDKHWRPINEASDAEMIERATQRYGARWYVDAAGLRDHEIHVPALVASLKHADWRQFETRRFDASASLAAFVVKIGEPRAPKTTSAPTE